MNWLILAIPPEATGTPRLPQGIMSESSSGPPTRPVRRRPEVAVQAPAARGSDGTAGGTGTQTRCTAQTLEGLGRAASLGSLSDARRYI